MAVFRIRSSTNGLTRPCSPTSGYDSATLGEEEGAAADDFDESKLIILSESPRHRPVTIWSSGLSGVEMLALEKARAAGFETTGWTAPFYKMRTEYNLCLRDTYHLAAIETAPDAEVDNHYPRRWHQRTIRHAQASIVFVLRASTVLDAVIHYIRTRQCTDLSSSSVKRAGHNPRTLPALTVLLKRNRRNPSAAMDYRPVLVINSATLSNVSIFDRVIQHFFDKHPRVRRLHITGSPTLPSTAHELQQLHGALERLFQYIKDVLCLFFCRSSSGARINRVQSKRGV